MRIFLIALLFTGSVLADTDICLTVPQNTDFDSLPPPIQEEITSLKWIPISRNITPNTKVNGGFKLMCGAIQVDADISTIESKILTNGLAWSLIGYKEALADASGNSVYQRKPLQATLDDYLTVDASENQSSLPSFQGHSKW